MAIIETAVEEVMQLEVVVMEEAEEEELMVSSEAEVEIFDLMRREEVIRAKQVTKSKIKGESPAQNVSSVMEIMPPLNVAI